MEKEKVHLIVVVVDDDALVVNPKKSNSLIYVQ
jgi:hypothetical protein